MTRARNRDHDRRRRQLAPWRDWYGTPEWRELRRLQLQEHPLCERFLQRGHRVFATVCDHRKPHRGNAELFFDPSNLASLCEGCHNGSKQREERRGYVIGVDATGRPLDKSHPWNANK